MKGIEIKNAGDNFGMFLMAMNVKFLFDYGTFIICNTHDIDKFTNHCKRNGVAETLLGKMEMSVVELSEYISK